MRPHEVPRDIELSPPALCAYYLRGDRKLGIDMRASNLVIGTTALAVIAAALLGVLGTQKMRSAQQRIPLRIVFEGGSASGLRTGGPVNFDGVPAGQIVSINLESPRKIVALVMLDSSAPLRKDTVVGIEFQGLTGLAAISLVGGAPAAPPAPLDLDGVPVLSADLSDTESMTETLHDIDRVITSNGPAIKHGLTTLENYTASLKNKSESIDAVVDKVNASFANIASALARIEGVVPSLVDGKADELFGKLKSIQEMADTLKNKSTSFIEEGRRTLLEISDGANKMSQKLDPRAAAPAPPPPRQQQPKRP
jgi:phospholipid/cholesterol/gamma-HCH transport system substrate-binding protein